MFRISSFIRELDHPTPIRPKANLPGPVVIWNLVRRCNLTCEHCYSISADKDFPGELSTAEIFKVMDDLHAAHVRVLILSGGEPLLHPDIFKIAKQAKELGFYIGLSSNGTLITADNIKAIAAAHFDYVGISLDGIGATHDHFRRKPGAFAASMAGIQHCQQHGIKVGVRYTMTEGNAQDFPALLKLVEDENIDKFYFSHLNYAGRGNKNRARDAQHRTTRQAMELLFQTCLDLHRRGLDKEIVTGNNDTDGPFFLHWVQQHFPDKAEHIEGKLRQWGGNASGVNVANIDNLGVVHPDTMWWHIPLGDVKTQAFSHIWNDSANPLLVGLKQHPRKLEGRCGLCRHLPICNGSSRVRAEQITGNPWAEDPACYLTDDEIGINPEDYGANPVVTTPWTRTHKASV